MKKVLLAGLFFVAFVLSTHSIGLYFDAGIGVGPAWTTMDDKDIVEILEGYTTGSGRLKEFAFEAGVKLGLGPFDTIPICIVGVIDGMGHRISDSNDDYFQYSSFLLGPGLIFYPIPACQIAVSLGYSFVGNDTSFSGSMHESKKGFAGDISVAYDLGMGNHALLAGAKLFGAFNTLETEVEQQTIMLSLFVRYAFRHKR